MAGQEPEKNNRALWEGDRALPEIPDEVRADPRPVYVHYRNGNLYRIITEESLNPQGEHCVIYHSVADPTKIYNQRRVRFFAYVGHGRTRTQRFKKVVDLDV